MRVGEQQLYRFRWSRLLTGAALWLCVCIVGAQYVSARVPMTVPPQVVPNPADNTATRSFVTLAQLDSIIPGKRDFLEPNAPNPFGISRNETSIGFTIIEEGHVRLRIYDFFYNEVVTLVDSVLSPGRTVVRFVPPPTMPSGMYFYELKTTRVRELRRMLYVK